MLNKLNFLSPQLKQTNKSIIYGVIMFVLVITLDQFSKYIFLNGYIYEGDFFDLYLVLNKGVSFSMFAFLGEYLKYIQIAILVFVILFFVKNKTNFYNYFFALMLIIPAGISNIMDRFIHGGVVDFFAWHYGFNFAVFNLADVFINIGIILIFIYELFLKKGEQNG